MRAIEDRTNKLIKDPEALKKFLAELQSHIDDDGDSDKL